MIILHNSFDKDSRDFVAKYGKRHVIIDWYNGGREQFEHLAFHKSVSQFPCVVLHVPPHKCISEGNANVMDVEGHHIITEKIFKPEDALTTINKINKILNRSKDLGLKVEPLSLKDLHRSDSYYRRRL